MVSTHPTANRQRKKSLERNASATSYFCIVNNAKATLIFSLQAKKKQSKIALTAKHTQSKNLQIYPGDCLQYGDYFNSKSDDDIRTRSQERKKYQLFAKQLFVA